MERVEAASLRWPLPAALTDRVLEQAHPAGERMFVEYAGATVDLIGGRSGEVRPAQIFVAVIGASNNEHSGV